MATLKEQKLRKLKKSYVFGSMIGFIVVGIIIFAVFASMLAIFALYIMDSKLRDERARAAEMARLYELSETSNTAAIMSALNDQGNDYIIIDDERNIIKEHGTNTCDLEGGGLIDTLGITESAAEEAVQEAAKQGGKGLADIHDIDVEMRKKAITVYPDTQMRVITPSINGRVHVDVTKFFEVLMQQRQPANESFNLDEGYVELPFWIDIPMSQGQHMVCRAQFTVYFRELAILSILAANIVVLTIIMLICMIVYIVKTIRNKKRMNEVFFMDEVTGKHNWMWFMSNAEKILTDKRNASNQYAVLDIVFVNYRNFCVCHSVKHGEDMLRKVDDKIQEMILKKKELAVHHSAAHFAALLRFETGEKLESRIREMISALETINNDHKFSFWVGVDMIPIQKDAKNRTVSRKNVDIEIEYNNAGAARATITTDDSAIAFFDDKMVEEQKWIDMIHENQQKALDNEEFVVFYQPKYDPRTEKLRGAEALIRWMSPEHGMISPGRFIPIFENNGFITQIDHYMLKHVAADQKRWLDAGYKCVPVSVNVSRAHFIESDLAEQILDIVEMAGTPHDLIEIELTESAFFDDKKALITTIGKLKEYGFTVSMDDFGSGYSSLNSLKEMPLDVLKLDADFFRNDDGTGRGQIVVSEAIALAKKLNMRTVAEGVEVRDQVEFLADQGCDMIQGFVFDKPMPGEDFEQKMK